MKDKDVFKFKEIDMAALASSFGLHNCPQVDFIKDNGEIPMTNTMSR